MNDNRTILYNALKNEGYTDIGENQEEFNKLLEKPENVRVAYDAMRNSGYTDIGDSYEAFAAMLVPNVEQKTTAPVPAQQPKGGENGFTLTAEELELEEEAVEEPKKEEPEKVSAGESVQTKKRTSGGVSGLVRMQAPGQKPVPGSYKMGQRYNPTVNIPKAEEEISAADMARQRELMSKQYREGMTTGAALNRQTNQYRQMASVFGDKSKYAQMFSDLPKQDENFIGTEKHEYGSADVLELKAAEKRIDKQVKEGQITEKEAEAKKEKERVMFNNAQKSAAGEDKGGMGKKYEDARAVSDEAHRKALQEFDEKLQSTDYLLFPGQSKEDVASIPEEFRYDYDFKKEFGYFPQGTDTEFWGFLKTKTGKEYQEDVLGVVLNDTELEKLREEATRLGFGGSLAQNFRKLGYDIQNVEAELLNLVANISGSEDAKKKVQERWEAINRKRDSFKPTAEGVGGFVAEMIPQMTGTGLGVLVSLVNPNIGAAIITTSTGVQIASSMGAEANEARRAGASDGQVALAMLLNGSVEFLTEKFVNTKYVKRVLPSFGKMMTETSGDVIDKEFNDLLSAAREKFGDKFTAKTAKGFIKDVIEEGGSEFAAEALQTLIPMIYENPEDYPTLSQVFENGLQGFLGGAFMGGVLGPSSSLVQRRANNKRRAAQGKVHVALVTIDGQDTVVEITGKKDDNTFVALVDNSFMPVKKENIKAMESYDYDFFKSLEIEASREEGYNTDPDTVNGSTIALANKSLDESRASVRAALNLGEDTDVDAVIAGKEFEGEAKAAVDTYLAEKAKVEGMRDRFNEQRDSEIAEADKSVDAVMHEDGNVYMTTLPNTGEAIFITGGKVVLDNEGYIDVNQSEGLVALMPNCKKEAVQPGNIREKVSVENAEAQKAAKRAEIDARYESQLNTFVYSDSEGDHTVMLVGRRGDMVDALIDGKPTEVPAKEFEAIMADATGKQPVVEGGEAKAESATSGDVVSPVETTQPIEQPGLSNGLSNETAQTETAQPQAVAPKVAEVPDFFRMGGKNYAVVSRNEDGSVTVDVDGKRAVLPAETNFTAAVPTDKGGKVLFTEMPAEKTLEYFVQRVPNGQARAQMIENNRKQAESALKKYDKEPNVGTDPDAYEATMNKWEADKKAAQAKVDYWNEVAKRDAEISQSEMRESVEAVKPREVVEMTPEEFVANQLGGIKITPESFQKETGTKAEQKQLVGVIAGKEKGGVSIERAAEIIYESYGDELRGLGFNGDMQDVRDMIIDVLSNGNPRSFAKKGLEMRQQTDVEQQLAELRGVANALNFESIEEQIAYEESIVPRIMQELKGFDETEYFNNLAENYENDTTRESENTRGSSELLQSKQSADNTGVADLAEPGQGGEVQGDVYSGGENATPQGNQQVNGSEIPNNLNRDNLSPVEGVAESEPVGQSGVAASGGNGLANAVLEKAAEKQKKNLNDRIREAVTKGRIKQWEKRTGASVRVVESIDEVTNRQARAALEAGQIVKGWIDGNEVVIYLPNIESVEDVDKTYIHEVVAHKGLKILMGKDFDKLCDKVWEMMSEELRKEYLAYIGANLENPTQADMRAAADEYMAYLAESVELTETEKGIWQKIVDAIREFLLGEGVKLTDKDIENLIRASYANLANKRAKVETPAIELGTEVEFVYGGNVYNMTVKNKSKDGDVSLSGEAMAMILPEDVLLEGIKQAAALKGGNGGTKFSKKGGKNKSSLNSAAPGKPVNATAKLDELFAKIDKLKQTYNSRTSKKTRGFITDIARELDLTKDESSHYRTFPTELGDITLRVSNHNSKLKEFEDRHEDEGVSIIISAKKNKKIDRRDSTGKSHVDEFFYPKQSLERSQGRPLVQILESIEDFLTTGVYVDKTGIAQPEDSRDIRFRKANENQEIFVSNARKAVEEIKQEKATPQQWLAMIKKNGGLKAGEDAWMGLSEWLEEKGKLKGENGKDISLTKQEVLDFVNENAIKIEEVHYDTANEMEDFRSPLEKSHGKDFADKFIKAFDIEYGEFGIYDEQEAVDLYNEANGTDMQYDEDSYDVGAIVDWAEGIMKEVRGDVREIYHTRLDYTTDGLNNKREIALTVPTVESYNIGDYTHFGDAGNGRAVAWVRFGETTNSEGNRVLVIDEIQSKRHQDGREKGYKSQADKTPATMEELTFGEYNGLTTVSLRGERFFFKSSTSKDEILDIINERIAAGQLGSANGLVPDAPFEKNWQELAMKRMLRLAAEEGFDKVAWTTGEQQAERYNLGKAFNDIEREDNPNIDGRRFVLNGANVETFQVDENGNIVDSTLAEAKGKPLADVVGKDMAIKMMSLENGDMLEGEELRVGGEGMKGFYDRMLPSFVQKYTKKWGAKVGTVEMPSLEQNNVMHSVDVTPEMKESVMEGQTMFRRGDRNDRNFENKNITLHTTGDGWIVRYEQLELFDTDERTTADIQRGASGGNQTADNRTRTGDIQRDGLAGGDALTLINAPLRPLEEGETSLVQRVFTKSKAFDFTAGEQIESLEDVAYIFKNLEDESIENSFAVLVKDGKPVVLHLGMGNYTTSIINASAVAVAMENVKPDKVYLVHNHPSGALRASNEDVAALEGFRTIYGDIVEKGIIINLKSGKFGIYDTAKETSEERSTKAEGGADVPVETFTFNKQVFDKDFNPAELFQVKNDSDVAAFISSNRLGDRNKIGLLVCNNQNRVVGNVFTPFVGITAASAKKVAKEIVYYTTVMGGNRPVMFGRFPALSAAAKSNLGAYIGLYSGGTIKLLDMVDVESRESVLYEDEMAYGDKSVDNSLNAQEERTLFSKKELTPEQKAKQEALKENAKAIRRLHNVTSRYPITALRNLGFALETQEQRDMHDRLFAERDAITGESMPAGLQTNPQAMTLQERITESLLKHAEQEKENVEMRLSAIRAYGRDLANVIKLMNAQKGYDKRTVRIFTDLVKMYLRNNAMSGMSSYKIIRLLNLMQKATGGHAKTVNGAAVKIAEIITNEHTSQLEAIMEKQMKTGAERVNASGVVVQGGVDIIGKRILNTYKDAINLDDKGFEEKYNDSFKRVGEIQKQLEENGSNTALENQLKEAQAEADAMLLAATYRNEVKAAEADITKIKDELTGKRTKAEKGEITWKEYHEFAKTINSQIVQLRAQQIDAYQKVLHALSGDIYEGVQRARAFREAEAMRVQRIHDMAESDMNGVDKSAERKEPGAAGKTVDMVVYKNPIVRTVMNGLGTYENYMKYFGRDHLDGRGELFNHFMTAFTEAQNKEWKESQNDFNILEAAAQEIFGKKRIGKTYKSIARESTKPSGVILKYWNGGATVERELTIGQLMYLYMTEKQAEGQMKLRNMGLTEEKVQGAVEQLPTKYKKFADYIQAEFLPQMRPRMNEVHQRMFGASMSEVENYFPLKVNMGARQGNDDLNNTADTIPSTITGSVIKRRVNVTPIDLMANAFDVLNEHIVDMEHWAAYAEFIRDNNTLINDKDFKNRVQNTKSVRYGDGKTVWNNFVDTARIATGNYKSKADYLAKLMSGANAAKITFGYYTALKQLSSLPAFLADANAIDLVWNTAKAYGSWQWAIKNLPGFEERWKGRTAGNERLGENEYSIHDSRIMKFARMAGMTPNAFIDAAVVAAGARAVYETRLRFYKSLGLTNYEADKRAKNDAAISYNETQQSGQGAYLSTLQKDGGLVALLTTLFRNSQMAFQRRVVGSMVEVGKKLARGEKIREATKQKYIKMGMSEEAAGKQANRDFCKAYAKDITNLAIFGYAMNYVWALMGELPYLLLGDDEEEKEKIFDTAAKMGITGTFEGFTCGNFAKSLYEKHITDGKYAVGLLEAPFEGDLQVVFERFEKDGTIAGVLQLAMFATEMNTGISPQRLIDTVTAFIYYSNGDIDKATRAQLFALRLLKAPQSQQDKLILDETDGADVEEVKSIAEWYIKYKMARNFPLGSEDEKRVDKYANKFVETLKERVEKDYNPEDISVIYDQSSDTEKEILKKKWIEGMDERNGTNVAKSLRKEKLEELLGSPVENAATKALHKYSKVNTYEKLETFEDLERWYEYKVLHDKFKSDYEKIRDGEELSPEERAKAVEHYGVYADKGFKEVINAIGAHKKFIKQNKDPEWRMSEVRRLTDIATEIMKRYE